MVSVSAILKEILLKLLGTIFSFYAVYYIAASLVHGILSGCLFQSLGAAQLNIQPPRGSELALEAAYPMYCTLLDNFDGTIPFHYQSYTTIFTNSTQWSNPVFLGDFISLECTYLTTPFVFFIFLSSRLWDYTITVTAVHCLLVCLVNLAFPLVWEWWVCIIISLLLSICLSELTSALIRKKKTGSFRPLQKDEDKVT